MLYQDIRYCERCGKKFHNKFMDYELCYDCLKHVHENIHKKLKTKTIYETIIDYEKFKDGLSGNKMPKLHPGTSPNAYHNYKISCKK